MEEISKRNILEQKQFFRSVFREIISEWRTEQKISQELFAKQCKLSRPRISDWKKTRDFNEKRNRPQKHLTTENSKKRRSISEKIYSNFSFKNSPPRKGLPNHSNAPTHFATYQLHKISDKLIPFGSYEK